MKSIINYIEQHSELNTPCYIYSKEILSEQIKGFRKSLPAQVQLIYSVKANPFKPLLETLLEQVDGFDVSSIRELNLVQSLKKPAKLISIVGPAKKPKEFFTKTAKDQEIHYIIESESEWKDAIQLDSEKNGSLQWLLRIHLETQFNYSGRKINKKYSQFGLSSAHIKEHGQKLLQINGKSVKGFHVHLGSQFLDYKITLENIRTFLSFIVELNNKYDFRPEILNFGGGFGIPYFDEQKPFAIDKFGIDFQKLLMQKEFEFLSDTKIIFELGRYLSGPSGFFVMKVVRRKIDDGGVTLIVDGGLGQNLSLIGFGQALKRPYTLKALKEDMASPMEEVTIAGPSCYTMDVIAEKISLPQLLEGDLLMAYNCGAYAKSFSPTNFLSFAEPEEILI